MFRRVVIATFALLALAAATTHASSTTVSPCRQVYGLAWSPDGKQIAFYGEAWPRPSGHRNPNSILQAFCVAGADGTNPKALRYTLCSRKCPDPPGQLAWLAPNALLALRDGDLLRFAPGSRPKRIGRINDFSFVTNTAGTRLAAGTPDCPQCAGPLTILSLPSGALVGHVGGKSLDNVTPSLSPDGGQVAFVRKPADDSGTTLGIWIANVDGRRLHRLVAAGEHPLWSPAGLTIAYAAPAGKTAALRLVPASGGTSRTLVPSRVQNVFGWSPDGRSIAFEEGSGTFGQLAVADTATGKVRRLLRLDYAPMVAWSPGSSELLAYSLARSKRCWSLRRVPVDGSASTLISSCTR